MAKEEERSWAEPYKIKMVEPVQMISREEREQAIKEAGYNTFLLKSRDVYIDLLTDSGTSAMSDRQWAGMMMGDEAYAGSENSYHPKEAAREYYANKHVEPTHQGSGPGHIIPQLFSEEAGYMPGNMYFTTTTLNRQLAGVTSVAVIM